MGELKGEFVLDHKKDSAQSVESTSPLKSDIHTPSSPKEATQLGENRQAQESDQKAQNGDAKKRGRWLSPFTSYCEYPEGIVFESQEENETILLFIRKHFITNLPWILGVTFLAILPLFIIPILPTLIPSLALSTKVQIVIIIFYYLIVTSFILVNFSIWYFNVTLVTPKRIIDIDVTGILFRNVAETKLDLIQDVSYTQIGAIRSFFNYGEVLVQTAGSLTNFELEQAPQPARIVRIIGELIGKK